jgi:hypothetical protein
VGIDVLIEFEKTYPLQQYYVYHMILRLQQLTGTPKTTP